MKSQASELWLEMALDAVEGARERMSVQEFDRRAKLMPLVAGAGYIDRMRVLDELIATQVIGINERRLILGQVDGIEWIMSGLASGNEVAWAIAEIVDRRGRVIRKFDAELLAEIGQKGELFVLNHLRERLAGSSLSQIRHMSPMDDSLGYDIVAPSVNSDESLQLLEVKTSVRPGGDFSFYLSRNEYRVGINNLNWSVVCVRIVRDQPVILGHLPASLIADRLPIDQDEKMKWASCRVSISQELLIEDLP